jgi:hypothetical protein
MWPKSHIQKAASQKLYAHLPCLMILAGHMSSDQLGALNDKIAIGSWPIICSDRVLRCIRRGVFGKSLGSNCAGAGYCA